MRGQRDYHAVLDTVAGLVNDAECGVRDIVRTPLPPNHRRHLEGALLDLEHAQDKLFKARRGDPCPPPGPEKQLALSL